MKFIGRGGSYSVDFLVDFFLLVVQLLKHISKNTPLKRNMFPENQWLEDVFPIEIMPLVLGGVSILCSFANHFFLKVLSDKVHMWMLGIVITTSSHTLGTLGNWRFTIDDIAKDADD